MLTDAANVPIGFLGLPANAIEALFLEPACRGQGWGRRLVAHAQELPYPLLHMRREAPDTESE